MTADINVFVIAFVVEGSAFLSSKLIELLFFSTELSELQAK